MIEIDSPIHRRSRNGRVKYCHMTADTLDELHEFAARAGIPRHWFHRSRRGVPHYDLNPVNRARAVSALNSLHGKNEQSD